MRAAALAFTLSAALAAGCSSAPSMDRPQVPNRPEVQRPDGVEPSGLAGIRDSIGEQRAAARERENALNVTPNTLSTTSTTPWYETALWPFAEVLHFLRNF